MFLYAVLVVCAFLATLLVVRYDLYDREPWWLLGLTVLAGAGAMHGLGPLEDWSIAALEPLGRAWATALVAATHEETARLVVVLLVAAVSRRHFNDPMDGLVYGSVCGIGMALYESWLFRDHIPEDQWIWQAPELVRIVGHLVLGGIACFGLGMWRLRMRRWRPALAITFTLAVALHVGVDWCATTQMVSATPSVMYTVAVAVLMLVGMLAFGVLTRLGSEWSRQVFRPDALPNLLVVPWAAWTSPLPPTPPEKADPVG